MRIDEVVLQFLEGENEGVEIKLNPTRELNIGRSEESDVFLGEKKISRRHCQIFVEPTKIRIVDLESTNGTFVNGKKISEMDLKAGDKIKVGSSLIEVKVQTKSKTGEESPIASADEKSAPKAPPPKKTPSKPEKKEPEKPATPAFDMSDMDDLEDLDKPDKAEKGKKIEEDSDLVVEYQTDVKMKEPVKEPPKEVKKAKDHDTSEKLGAGEASSPEFEEIDLDQGSHSLDEVSEPEASAPKIDEQSFDKIPEIEDLEVNPDFGTDLDEEEVSKPKSTKPLMGDLSSMGLSDLIQNLNQNKKTGILTLSTDTSSGKIYIREGGLQGAECDQSQGVKALYRMLTWKTGDFEFQPVESNSKEINKKLEAIPGSIEGILMEGFRQYDELKKIQKVLPQMEDSLVLEEKLEVPISKLHPKVLDVVQLIINHKKMKSILDLSPLSDLETSKIVFYLIKKKVIRIKN